MNLKRGVNRIALVLSFLWFVYFSVLAIIAVVEDGWESDMWTIFPVVFCGPVLVWILVQVVFRTGLFIVKGFSDNKPKDEQKLKAKAIKWGRGFRRIVFTLSVIAAITCAIFFATIIMDTAKSNWAWKQQEYERKYLPFETMPDGLFLDLDAETVSELKAQGLLDAKSVSELKAEGLSDKEIQDYAIKQTANLKAEQVEAKRKFEKEKKSFWLWWYGLCGVGGLAGGISVFFVVWFIYKMFEWLAAGFKG